MDSIRSRNDKSYDANGIHALLDIVRDERIAVQVGAIAESEDVLRLAVSFVGACGAASS
jgi:hypothetical protein